MSDKYEITYECGCKQAVEGGTMVNVICAIHGGKLIAKDGFKKIVDNKTECKKCFYYGTVNDCYLDLGCVLGSEWLSRNIKDGPSKPVGKYESIGRALGEMVDGKASAYGSSTTTATEIVKLLYPNGVKTDQLHDMLLIVRVADKLCRIANKKDAFGENPWLDVAGYGMIGSNDDTD